MSIALAGVRSALLPGAWARNDLWRRARAVPSLDLRFADTKSLADAVTGQSLVTFTRASTGTYVGSDGLIKTAAVNEARFDHNPSTGESLGLLVEEARTNLLTYSEQFDNAAWVKSNSTVTANAGAAPNGTATADLLYPNSSGTIRSIYQSVAGQTSGASYTNVVYAKSSGIRYICLSSVRGTSARAAWFDLQTGAVGTVAGGVTASIQNAGSGWYRCSVTDTSSSTTIYFGDLFLTSADNSTSVTANGTDGVLLWGAQLEAGAFPTSYIPTTTATVTRSADVASITGANFSGWYNQSEGTMFGSIRTRAPASANNGFLFQFTDGTSNNRIELLQQGSGSAYLRIATLFRSLGVTTANFLNEEIGWAADGITVDNVALGWSSSGFILQTKFSPNPGTGSGSYPQNLNQVVFQHTGTISRLTYWPTRLSNPTLQAITQ